MKKQYYYHNVCNFCNARDRRILFSFSEQNLVRCSNCKLVYFDNQRIDLEELYNGDYYSTGEGNSTANYADYQTQEETIKKNFSFAYSYITKKRSIKKKRLLEIGPGYGYFLKNLPSSISSDGVEVSKEAVLYMKKERIKITEGDFLDVKLKQDYDFIVAFDVIEHQIYLKQYLQKVLHHLKPNGTFIITTPDFSSLPNKLLGKRAPTIQPLYHNYYFDKQWLIEQMPRMGFKIVSIKTEYFAYLSVGQIILLSSFAFPFLHKLHLAKLAQKLNIDNVVLPFFRLGGIECIMQKTD